MRSVPLRLCATLLVVAIAGCTSSAGKATPEPVAGPAVAESRSAAPGADGAPGAQLIAAAAAGDVPELRRLLGEGADVDARDRQGRTALVAAAYGNHLEAAQLLVGAGADVDAEDGTQQNLYLIATSEVGDDLRLLELALAAGADPQAKDSFDGTGLIRAAERGHPRIVGRLLEAGVDVDHVNRLGWTALLEAVVLGDGSPRYVETVRRLLGAGADPRLRDRDGVPPLAHAQRSGHTEIADLLRVAERSG